MYTVGRVLNRFSKDVGFIDDVLPYVFCEYLVVSCRLCFNLNRYITQKSEIYPITSKIRQNFLYNFLVFRTSVGGVLYRKFHFYIILFMGCTFSSVCYAFLGYSIDCYDINPVHDNSGCCIAGSVSLSKVVLCQNSS